MCERLLTLPNSLAHAFEVLRTKRGKEEAAQYRQLAKAIELDTHSTTLPKFSIQESFAWLTSGSVGCRIDSCWAHHIKQYFIGIHP